MAMANSKEQHYFDLAFELAYCIHINKEIAFFVAEDALDGLALMLGRHEKDRKPLERLRGFLKSGERTRPIRKTIRLNEQQMLQWLVYRHSESWERQTEQGEGFYLPTEEDLIVRYIKHLVFATLRRGSFYVTLAVGTLLHQFNRRETRLFYDILTQSDSARMKDMTYIGKQRLEMLERVSQRFGQMIEPVRRSGDEKQFAMRPTTPWVIDLVNESLRRFTPWETACLVEPGFDVTDIPGLYYSETSAQDEELIEMSRIHTVLDPHCFARFTEGLSKYIRILPEQDQDKSCNYNCPDERLMIPQFANFPSGSARGDRFQSPKLTKEDYVRLQRTLDARAHRRKAFIPRHLCLYIDGVLSSSCDLKMTNSIRYQLMADADFIEVRGRDAAGELTLAMLHPGDSQAQREAFEDSFIQPGGQKVTVRLTPNPEMEGAIESAQLEVRYTEPYLRRPVSRLVRRVGFGLNGGKGSHDQFWAGFKSGQARLAKAGVATTLIMVVSALIWWLIPASPPKREVKQPTQSFQPHSEEQAEVKQPPAATVTPTPLSKPAPTPKEGRLLIASAAWSRDREAALRAVSVEPTRGEPQSIDLSRRQAKILLSLPLYSVEGQIYSSYRVSLFAAETRLWQQTLSKPKASLTGYAHILDLSLFTRRLPETGPYKIHVEGHAQGRWRLLGSIALSPTRAPKS